MNQMQMVYTLLLLALVIIMNLLLYLNVRVLLFHQGTILLFKAPAQCHLQSLRPGSKFEVTLKQKVIISATLSVTLKNIAALTKYAFISVLSSVC